MRVKMSEQVDVSKDFTVFNLNVNQKISAIFGFLLLDSKILRSRKKSETEKEEAKKSQLYESMLQETLTLLQLHLVNNQTLAQKNKVCEAVQLTYPREHKEIVDKLLSSARLNVYLIQEVELDKDIIIAFRNEVPICIEFRRKQLEEV